MDVLLQTIENVPESYKGNSWDETNAYKVGQKVIGLLSH